MLPNGLPTWTADAMPGHLHDLTCAQNLDITAALNWAAAELDLPTLADAGYEGAGNGTARVGPSSGRRELPSR